MTRGTGLLAAALLALAACHDPAPPDPPPVPAGEDPERWLEAIEAFEAEPLPEERPAVFVGSSSIRRWTTLAEDMAPVPVLNRGFGGSRIFDAVHWVDRLVVPHDPTVVVVFSGTNDLNGEAPRSAGWVAARFDELIARLRALGCDAPVVYIAISPTPRREAHLAAVLETNAMIRARCEGADDLHFVDTASGLLDADGRPDPRWFTDDRLHLNAEGYAAWTARIRPLVERLDAARRAP